jgi:hypothetical protein
MLSLIQRLFDHRSKWPHSVIDSVLGELRLSEDADWWEGNVALEGKSVGFKIGGWRKPDQKLLGHAYDIVRSFANFEHMIADFLASEAREAKCLGRFADEIRKLNIKDVCLFWPKRPNDGMIYFRGPDQYRVWRCDYVTHKPRGLGFDS